MTDIGFSMAQEQIKELRAEIEGLREEVAILRTTEAADNERLRALVKDLADDLEAELNGHYPPEVRAYPSEQRRYERDMVNVYEARRALALRADLRTKP